MSAVQKPDDDEAATSKWGIVVLVLRLLLAAIVRACTSPFKGANGAPTYFKDVLYATIRKKLQVQTIAQYRQLDPLTPEVYRQWTKKHHVEQRTDDLGGGAQAHWLGPRNADRVIAYYHGGGYTQPLQPGYFDYLYDMIHVLSTPKTSVSVAVLSYTLAPKATFPTQLTQGVVLINHLLEALHIPSSSIILMGDSAGGHLVLSVLSHLLHPHPQVPIVRLTDPFRAVLVISPWVSFKTTAPSYKRNLEKDCLDVAALRRWSNMFRGHTKGYRNYLEALEADASWWDKASSIADNGYVWAGKDEIFVDDITEWAAKYQSGWSEEHFDFCVSSREAHCQPLVDVLVKDKKKSPGALRVESWLKRAMK